MGWLLKTAFRTCNLNKVEGNVFSWNTGAVSTGDAGSWRESNYLLKPQLNLPIEQRALYKKM